MLTENITPGTEMYLEGFKEKNTNTAVKESKPKEKFHDLDDQKEKEKKPFIPKSGPLSEGNGFTANQIEPGADKAAKKKKTENHFNPKKFSQVNEKTGVKKINNYKDTMLMNEKNKDIQSKSDFDRLCEEVLGPEEVELGIENPKPGEDVNVDVNGSGEEGAESACPACDRIREIITELEGVLAELEGTGEGEDLESGEPVSGEGESLEGAGNLESPVKEEVDSEDLGTPITSMKKGKPDAVTGKSNVVDGTASKVEKGPGQNADVGGRDGKMEKAPDGEKAFSSKPGSNSYKVSSKITGKNQNFYNA